MQRAQHDLYAGWPDLAVGASRDGPQLLHALLERGADPNATTSDGLPILTVAVLAGTSSSVEALLAAGAQPTRPDRRGNSPLLHQLETNGSRLDNRRYGACVQAGPGRGLSVEMVAAVSEPFGDGLMRMPFVLGNIALGSFPVIPTFKPKPSEFWISIRDFGKARLWQTMIL